MSDVSAFEWLSLGIIVMLPVVGALMHHALRTSRTQVVHETKIGTLEEQLVAAKAELQRQLERQDARHREETNKIWTKFDELPVRMGRLEEGLGHVKELLTAIYHDVHPKQSKDHDHV